MIEESKIASGSASGTSVMVAYISNCATIGHSSPLPTKSSRYLKRNCITRMKSATRNVSTNGPANEIKTSLYNFFMQLFTDDEHLLLQTKMQTDFVMENKIFFEDRELT